MKISNRIMSWILSPGAYALWHSMGNPDEWSYRSDSNTSSLRHHSGVSVEIGRWWNLPLPFWLIPLLWIAPMISWAFWPAILDCEGPFEGSVGYLERHFIAGRAMRLRGKLVKSKKVNHRKQRNRDLFTKLTINQVVE